MPARRQWTPAEDAEIIAARTGETRVPWRDLMGRFGCTRTTLVERARCLGVVKLYNLHGAPLAQPAPRPVGAMRDWQSKRPGHPATWGLITRGTCLEDAKYQG